MSGRGSAPGELGYRPYEEVEETPHLLVDGAARRSSVLCLSHWPHSPTPAFLARDLSAEIAFASLRLLRGDLAVARRDRSAAEAVRRAVGVAEAVTNDHFDEDGLVAVAVFDQPALALAHEGVLVDAASCGDFGVVRTDRGAEVAFALGPIATAEAGASGSTGDRYRAVLARLGELLEHPDRFAWAWGEEVAQLQRGRAAIDSGEVSLDDRGDDLAVVRRRAPVPGRLPGAKGGYPVHAAAVHSRTAASRILAVDGARIELRCRYEGWVRVVSRPVAGRTDLAPLAAELSALEPGGIAWTADGPSAIVCRLRPAGEGVSELDPSVVEERVRAYLSRAEVAFDPFDAAERAGWSRRWRAGG